jgi:ribonuclease HI
MSTTRDLLRLLSELPMPAAVKERHPALTEAGYRAALALCAERAPEAPLPELPPKAVNPNPSPAPTVAGPRRVRVYSDGASRGNPGLAGAGAVLADPATGVVLTRLKRFLGAQTNNVAEYEAVLLGLRGALELGVKEVEVYADSQLMIRQLDGQYAVKAPGIKPLYAQAMALLKQFEKVKLVHIPREQNTDADDMSNRAIDER